MGEISSISVTKIARTSGMSIAQIEQCFKRLAEANIWEILTSYDVVSLETGKTERFNVVKPLYLFHHPSEIDTRACS